MGLKHHTTRRACVAAAVHGRRMPAERVRQTRCGLAIGPRLSLRLPGPHAAHTGQFSGIRSKHHKLGATACVPSLTARTFWQCRAQYHRRTWQALLA